MSERPVHRQNICLSISGADSCGRFSHDLHTLFSTVWKAGLRNNSSEKYSEGYIGCSDSAYYTVYDIIVSQNFYPEQKNDLSYFGK